MNPESPSAESNDPLPSFEGGDAGAGGFLTETAAPPAQPAKKDAVQAYDFRHPMLLAPLELRKLRNHQEEFVQSMASRLSAHLRLEVVLKLAGIQTISYQCLADTWNAPSNFSLFKLDPFRGVSILDISTQLGFCMIDRLMGGSGLPSTAGDQEISEIEKVLLEQTVQLFLDEWCRHWAGAKELKPVILGYENNGSYIQATSREAIMLVLTLEGGFGECKGTIHLAVPFAPMEPLIKKISQSQTAEAPAQPAPAVSVVPQGGWKWNPAFNDVPVPVTAEWEGLELTARQILALKVGDVLPIEPHRLQQINVRVADTLKFKGCPGTQAGQWAVELTRVIKS